MTSTPAMNTTALKNFATESRTQLLDQMRVRIGQVLTDTRTELEHPTAVALLKKAVADRGIGAVTEEAAYTWFNRLTAARYMDVNGFSGMYRVISPAEGSTYAFPEILAQARAGNFDSNVSDEARQVVSDLLSGQRQSDNPDFEAYAVLLRTVFHTWHGFLPSVFPASVDWVEILIPVDMLTQTAVRARTVELMDALTCVEVEVVGWLYQFYISDRKDQINDSKVKINAEEIGPVTQLFTPHWVVRYLLENSLGRLWLRSKSSSGLRSTMDYYVEPVEGQTDAGATVASPEEIRLIDPACGSGHMLTYAFDLLYTIYEEEGYAPSDIPRLILSHNLVGTEIDPRAAQLASFALAMKARTRDRRFFTRGIQPRIALIKPTRFTDDEIRAIIGVHESVSGTEDVDDVRLELLLRAFEDADTFGALIRVDAEAVTALEHCADTLGTGPDAIFTSHLEDPIQELLNQAHALVDEQYHVVVANPPYLSSKKHGDKLSKFLKSEFPDSRYDICTSFIDRMDDLSCPLGYVSVLAQKAWMHQSSYKDFRKKIFSKFAFSSLLELGSRAFESISGEKVNVAAFVAVPKSGLGKNSKVSCFDLTGLSDGDKKRIALIDALSRRGEFPIEYIFEQSSTVELPGQSFMYWLTPKALNAFKNNNKFSEEGVVKSGLSTGDDELFSREFWEVSHCDARGRDRSSSPNSIWGFCSTGKQLNRWSYGPRRVVRWSEDDELIPEASSSVVRNKEHQGLDGLGFTKNGSSFEVGLSEGNSFFDDTARRIYSRKIEMLSLAALLNSAPFEYLLNSLCRGTSFTSAELLNMPIVNFDTARSNLIADQLASIFHQDWNQYETSWNFTLNPIVALGSGLLEKLADRRWIDSIEISQKAQSLEEANNRYFTELYDLKEEVGFEVPLSRISLTANPYFRYAPAKGATRTEAEYKALFFRDVAKELISYAVGCMMGRYSLDRSGLVLADAGDTLEKFNHLVPDTSFQPDDDGIIPITEGEYIPDDITARFHEFLAVAFGTDSVKSNVAWIEEALTTGAKSRKTIEDYFLNDFYDDHIQVYSKRPIYWQFSSPNKGFNALVYLHRYTPATIGLIHQNYAEEHLDKLQARLDTITHTLPNADKRDAVNLGKERDTITARIREIRTWVDDVLFRMSTERIALDLDDGVKVNYPKLAGAVKKVTGL